MSSRRRGKGEGNIYQRDDSRWAGRISDGYRKGKRARRWVYGKTRADVVAKMRKALKDQDDGVLTAPSRQTVGQFLQAWLDVTMKSKLRPRTFVSYAQVARLHIMPGLGHLPLQKLAPQHVQRWLTDLQKDGLSPRTCNYARAILRSALSQALRWGAVSRNVATLVDAPRVAKHEIRPLQPEQARALLAFARSHRLGGLFTVALALGLRQGEALGLQWEAIDFRTGSLQVRAALQWVGKAWQLVEPKSARSRRSVVMPHVVALALRAHRVQQRKERLLAGAKWRDTGFVFTTKVGTPIEPSNLTKEFKRLLEKAGLPEVRFHDLRHTAATFLLAQGVDPRTIMETLGHSQISLTLNTYSHVLPSLQKEAAGRIDALLFPARSA